MEKVIQKEVKSDKFRNNLLFAVGIHNSINTELIQKVHNYLKTYQAMLQKAKLAGVVVLPVSTEDLCIYLTEKSKGGIDDVFDQFEHI